MARSVDNIAGGVERAVSTLMNALSHRGHDIEFLTWDSNSATSFYQLSDKIVWHRLNLGNLDKKPCLQLRLQRLEKIRRIITGTKPDLVICFQNGPFMQIKSSTLGTGIPVLVAVRNAPTRFMHVKGSRSQTVVYNFFRLARSVIVQWESYISLYPEYLKNKLVAIANPVFEAPCSAQPEALGKDGKFYLLSVGRLGYQKNYAVLIEAFAQLATVFPNWNLLIVGEGEHREELTTAIKNHGLSKRILLPGHQKNIESYYQSAHCFVLTSRWEGFPNALAEAMAHGLPSVGFDDCAGVNQLIKSGCNGLLAEGNGDVESLVNALRRLMDNSGLRAELGARGKESIKKYAPDQIFDRWEMVLTEAAQSKPQLIV